MFAFWEDDGLDNTTLVKKRLRHRAHKHKEGCSRLYILK